MTQALKILIVDDDSISLGVTVALLEDCGHDVQQRGSALGTLVAVQREKPDVVLLDVQMPGLSGDMLSSLLAAKLDYQPIVILHSTTAAAELEALARSSNAAGFIEKTSDHRAFLRAFERIVSGAPNDRARHDNSPRLRTR